MSSRRFPLKPEQVANSIRTRNVSDGRLEVFIQELPPVDSRRYYRVAVSTEKPASPILTLFVFREVEYSGFNPIPPFTHRLEYDKNITGYGPKLVNTPIVELVEEQSPPPGMTRKGMIRGSITSLAPKVSQASSQYQDSSSDIPRVIPTLEAEEGEDKEEKAMNFLARFKISGKTTYKRWMAANENTGVVDPLTLQDIKKAANLLKHDQPDPNYGGGKYQKTRKGKGKKRSTRKRRTTTVKFVY